MHHLDLHERKMGPVTVVRSQPCQGCPYRRDVPSGVWHRDEYDKLRPYDAETWAQPPNGFGCHVNPDRYCAGWVIVHSNRGHAFELLALRINPAEIPTTDIALFESGNAAADHGSAHVDDPSPEAINFAQALVRKHAHIHR